jgi:hypothetical protein
MTATGTVCVSVRTSLFSHSFPLWYCYNIQKPHLVLNVSHLTIIKLCAGVRVILELDTSAMRSDIS